MIGRDILGIEDLSRSEIELILETAERMQEIGGREVKKVPTLRGRTLINLFFEPSTRTQTSFEIAGKRLSADVVNFSVSDSSVSKRETLLDTAKTLDAMDPDAVIVRHKVAGVPHRLAEVLHAPGSFDDRRERGAVQAVQTRHLDAQPRSPTGIAPPQLHVAPVHGGDLLVELLDQPTAAPAALVTRTVREAGPDFP